MRKKTMTDPCYYYHFDLFPIRFIVVHIIHRVNRSEITTISSKSHIARRKKEREKPISFPSLSLFFLLYVFAFLFFVWLSFTTHTFSKPVACFSLACFAPTTWTRTCSIQCYPSQTKDLQRRHYSICRTTVAWTTFIPWLSPRHRVCQTCPWATCLVLQKVWQAWQGSCNWSCRRCTRLVCCSLDYTWFKTTDSMES